MEAAILTFTQPQARHPGKQVPFFALCYLAKRLKSLVSLGHIRVHRLELRSWGTRV